MSKGQTTVWLGEETKKRLRLFAARRNAKISQLAKELIIEGLDRIDGGLGEVKRAVLEEVLIAIFGIEQIVLKGFLDPRMRQDAEKRTKRKLLFEVDTEARRKTRELLGGGGR